jgi:hypothetical protein
MNRTIIRTFPLGNKNKNGRVYTREHFINLNTENMYGELDHPSRVQTDLGKASHRIDNVIIKNAKLPRKTKKKFILSKGRDEYNKWCQRHGKLIISAEILDTNTGNMVKVMKDQLVLAPRGTGMINEDGIITNYTVHSFDLIQKSEASFKSKQR